LVKTNFLVENFGTKFIGQILFENSGPVPDQNRADPQHGLQVLKIKVTRGEKTIDKYLCMCIVQLSRVHKKLTSSQMKLAFRCRFTK
jgi:hypothetical protein